MKIVFCGYGRAALECFYQLLSNYKVDRSNIIVFTHSSKGNEEFIRHLEVNNIKFSFESINKNHEKLSLFKPDYLLSVYYRFVVKKEILELVNYKAMNSHPSLLPAYRGVKSSVWAILNGEKYTGVSYHFMNDDIDDGKLILQKKISISQDDTAFSLYHKLISLFSKNFTEAFDLLKSGYEGFEQVGEATYYKRELPHGGMLKFEETTFDYAKRFVRAMYYPPFKGAFFIDSNEDKVEVLSLEELAQYKEKFKLHL